MRYLTILITLFLISLSSTAHQFSTANLTMEQTSAEHHQGFIELSLGDLQQTLQLDPDHNGQLTWGEVTKSKALITDYLNNHLAIKTHLEDCDRQWGENISLVDSYGEVLLRQPLAVKCNGDFSLHYSALFETTNSHKLLVNWLLDNGQTQTVIANPDFVWKVHAGSSSMWDTFVFYLYQGMIHIWIGLDHVLFLLTLLLHFKWKRATDGAAVTQENYFNLKHLLWLITGFTLAHSITLTLTALNLITVSSKWAEVGIAISVAFAALNAMTHWVRRIMIMTVAFGLLHGLGFAGALSELGLSKTNQITSIIGFNLGVEIGQIFIILAATPILWLLSKKHSIYRVTFPLVTSVIFLLGLYWVWERI